MTNATAHVQTIKCQSLAATIVEDELELVAPFIPINRGITWISKYEIGCEENKREEKKRVVAMAVTIAAAASAAMRAGVEFEWM